MISSEDRGWSLDDRVAADGEAAPKDGTGGLKEGLGLVDLLLGSLGTA